MPSQTPLSISTSQVLAEVVDLMIQANNYRRINRIEDFNRIRQHVIALAVPVLETTTTIDGSTFTLIDALTDLGSRPRAVVALERAEHVLTDDNPNIRQRLRQLIEETNLGPPADGEATLDVCRFYACQACGRLQQTFAIGCPSCGFLPSTPREIAVATLLTHPLLEMNLVVAVAQHVKNGEKFKDFFPDLDGKVTQRMASQGWPVYLERQQQKIAEAGVDWLLTLPEASCCSRCQLSLPASDATVCSKCDTCIDFPPMQRAFIAADRLISLIEDFILLDPSDGAKQMLSSIITMRDQAFFYQAIPSLESLMVFRNYWEGQVDLWDWDLEYAFRVRDGQFVSGRNKGEHNALKGAKAKEFASELSLFNRWLFNETAIA
ncbi:MULTISPECIES: hypothetical protein [Rhodanobacter]|uniref:hypothetical protein n=1 Tax=Rhodanobacter TaxID=75309 RepID=UPI0012044339|nr:MULTISPECIES: hypothetical protein [Rhodanobacter]TAN17143.1 MAG: hypothetical protein EPN35_08020 [Rhodanobacter sp.]UJJ53729.1 hypothetical protein LRK53_12195 [Rhodanobacter thiooxydans]